MGKDGIFILKQISEYYMNANEIEWNKLIDDFTPYIRKIINNMCNLSEEDKEEILLDTFFVLWKNKSNIDVSLNSYIIGITKNLVREKCRKKKVTYDIEEYKDDFSYLEFDMFTDEREEISKIEKSFSKLKKSDLEIVNMFYYSAQPIKIIAKKMKISEFNVATRLYRIREKIKKEIGVGGKYGRK